MPYYLLQFKHKGFWTTNEDGKHEPSLDENCNRNSVMISEDCLFYVYKIAFRHLLLSMGVVTPTDMDNANMVPHVVVRKNKTDPFSKYKTIQGEHFIIGETELSVKNDFVIMELDTKRDLHMTLIYSKGIGKKLDLVDAFSKVIKILNYRPELIKMYSQLDYFGTDEINYWYDTGDQYPDNIVPKEYIPEKPEEKVIPKVTEAGSIIE